MKYSKKFERDCSWYLSVRHSFNFSGKDEVVVYDKKGVDGKEAFYKFDSTGKLIATKHPNLFHTLLKTKGSVNLHIKMYAEDRANGVLPKVEFDEICKQLNAPEWFENAVENQKALYYK